MVTSERKGKTTLSTDSIRVALRVRPLIKREKDCHLQTHWRVEKNSITQLNNGKLMQNSSYIFDQIFDSSSSTKDVYKEFGRPIVLSAMDGFNGTLFAYGQTSSGKTYTMMGDQRNEGVIPMAIGEMYDYIEKHPSREFLIRVSYMEIYNEDIRDLLNPSKTNLKVHENAQRQVYVGELTEEVVTCSGDVFKHMQRGEKNRHFGETNMNDRSSRSHTIFRVVIESREMMSESREPDTIDGAVRVAHLNLVDLAGSERASQTGAFGQRLREGGHINKSLLALGSVIGKLSEGESFVPFRDSKLTRILQSSLGGNAKTSMICTITTAAIEETISTLKFASRAKTIKNCPEVNEVLDDGTLLKRYRKEICELKKQLTEMNQESSISRMQELEIEKEKMVEMLEKQRVQQSEQEEKIKRLRNMICSAGREDSSKPDKEKMAKRRLTWCPGAALSKAPLASAAAVQGRLQRVDCSPSDDGEFEEIPKDQFLSILDEEEERRSKQSLSSVLVTEWEDKEIQTESGVCIEFEKIKDEKKELEQLLERIKKERDEIRNDLSESITDSVELQKEMMQMQQQLKAHKENILEVEKNLEEKNYEIASYREKIDDLEYQLSLKSEKLSTENSCEHHEQCESEDLDSLLTQEQERTQKLSEQCRVYHCTTENLKSEKVALENERNELRKKCDELHVNMVDLNKRLADSEQRLKSSEERLHEDKVCEKLEKDSQTLETIDCSVYKDLEKQSTELKEVGEAIEKQLKKERERNEELVKELEHLKTNKSLINSNTECVQFEEELQKIKNQKEEELVKELREERRLHETLRKEHRSLSEELQHLKDSLLRDTNRDMDQQRVIEKMKAERRETICIQAQQRQGLEKDLHSAETKVSELESQCSCLKIEKDLLEHRFETVNRKLEETKQEMRDMENLYSSHNTLSITNQDDNKALQKLKQMELCLDLTKQKCQKAEARVKELENENRQLKGAEIRNGSLLDERDNLRQQVQEAKKALAEKSKKLSEFSIEVTQLRAHVDKVSEENKKSLSSLEKKENKIDHLEQKLWKTEEELRLEKQRYEEQKVQGPALEELNSTIRVKHEELEQMTFLVDEKDIEIAEVRLSLQQNEAIRMEMSQKMKQKEEKLIELESGLEDANNMLQRTNEQNEQNNAQMAELKAIIQKQEQEIISVTEKHESWNAKSDHQRKELQSKLQSLEIELQDSRHKVLEVEVELEYVKASVEKAATEKQELQEIVKAYSEAIRGNDAVHITGNEESLRTQLQLNLERLSILRHSANELEMANVRIKDATEGRRLLEENLVKLQSLLKEEKTAREEAVAELEDLKFAVNDKMATEAELRRALEEKESNTTNEVVDELAYKERESGFPPGLEMTKENVLKLNNEIANLRDEISSWESLVKAKELALEEEKKARCDEIARCTQCFEEEKHQLLEQLRKNFTDSSNKSEIIQSLKNECEATTKKLRDTQEIYFSESDRLKGIIDDMQDEQDEYVRQIDEFKAKTGDKDAEISELRRELTESKNIGLSAANEMESLKTECDVAKKKCKDAQEKYFSESDRLKAIIDEMQDEEEEFMRQIAQLKENGTKKDCEIDQLKRSLAEREIIARDPMNSGFASEIGTESLRTEYELAKTKRKDAEQNYSTESERLKAPINKIRENIGQSQVKHKIEDEMDATRIELAQKNMQIQSLQYDLYKLQEKYENERRALFKEVEFGREKVALLNQEIRRLKQPEQEDTICMMRGQPPVPTKENEVSNVGVVSNVAIFSLKAKVGKLETEAEKRNNKIQQLEKEKATLTLLNTEASNTVAQLTSENRALKTQRKKLLEEVKAGKVTKREIVSSGRMPEAPTTTLGLSTVGNVDIPSTECERGQSDSTKENFQNWLSGDAANDLFKDDPDQCINQ
ncbi:uncharacterized protein [Acropora muricata]|uniref:uncharacterized protein isoform X3 n=1 Tax=Acropora muricata TaxID=159855 RepID=UPI0034E48881